MKIFGIVMFWMILNMWIVLAYAEHKGEFLCGWDDYLDLFLCSIFSLPVMLLITRIRERKKK